MSRWIMARGLPGASGTGCGPLAAHRPLAMKASILAFHEPASAEGGGVR